MVDGLTPGEWLALGVSPVVASAVILFLMQFAPAWGLIDHPGHRKVHAHPTALVGGLGVLATLLVLQLMLGRIPFESMSLLAALLVITVIGVADDAHELSHRAKFVAQILGAGIIVSGTSVWVQSLGNLFALGNVELGKWAILVSIISIVGVMNAINMIDGLDGLAGSVSLASFLVLAWVSVSANSGGITFELLLVGGAIAGFLTLNLRIAGRQRARVFMGDTGGMIFGLLLAWYSIKLGGTSSSAIKPITAVWVLAVPLLDMGSVMLLRLSQGKSPFHADQQHMHHVLLHAGYSVNQVVAIMAGTALASGVLGLALERGGCSEAVMFAAFLVVWAAYTLALKYPLAFRPLVASLITPAERKAMG